MIKQEVIEITSLRKILRNKKTAAFVGLGNWGIDFRNSVEFADRIYSEMFVKEVKTGS